MTDPARPALLWRDTLPSTQDEAARLAGEGAPLPLAVATTDQRGGRGRLGRTWIAPPGSGLALTLAVRTALPVASRSWMPLAAGLAALDALEEVLPGLAAACGIGLKWPNDVLTGEDRKLCGILVEARGGDTVLLGIGTNLRGPVRDADGTQLPSAAWLLGPGGLLAQAGRETEEAELAPRLADALAPALLRRLAPLEETGGDARAAGLLAPYRMSCVTLGRGVRVQPLGAAGAAVPGASRGQDLVGRAVDIDPQGRLVVQEPGGARRAVDAGDVLHAGLAGPRR